MSDMDKKIELIGQYKNGNYQVEIFNDGTKIRSTKDDYFQPDFSESMDLKITNYCNLGCEFCHENSTTQGKHGNILDKSLIDSIHPYTEVAIGGGNPLSHPDLDEFLGLLKERNIIANITVNQTHFMKDFVRLKEFCDNRLIHGLGVSFTRYTKEFEYVASLFPNLVLHVINGIVDLEDLKNLYGKGFKILILGYKQIRRGALFYSDKVKNKQNLLFEVLPHLVNKFDVLSFDNLAIEQLDVRRLMSKNQWEQFYMGDDGQYTFYIDLVDRKFARNSCEKARFDLWDSVYNMFNFIKNN